MSNQRLSANSFKEFFNRGELDFLRRHPKFLEEVGKVPNTDRSFAKWRQGVKRNFKNFQKLKVAGKEIRECKTIDARLINNIRLVQKAIEDDFDYSELGLTEEIFNDRIETACQLASDLLGKNQNDGLSLTKKQRKLVDSVKKNNLLSFTEEVGFHYEAKNFAPRELLVHKQQSIDVPGFVSLASSLSGPQIF